MLVNVFVIIQYASWYVQQYICQYFAKSLLPSLDVKTHLPPWNKETEISISSKWKANARRADPLCHEGKERGEKGKEGKSSIEVSTVCPFPDIIEK